MMLNPSEIKIIIRDKLQGKTDTQIKLDILQDAVVSSAQSVGSLDKNDLIELVHSTIQNLIDEGKLLVDATGAIIDHSI